LASRSRRSRRWRSLSVKPVCRNLEEIVISKIARKEFIEMTRDGRFRWAAAIVLSLLLAALAAGWKHYREVNAQHETARRITRDHWLTQTEKNPHSAAHYGIYAFKPKMLLSLAERGVDPYTGVTTWLEAHKQNEFKYRPAQDATAVQRFGELTASTILQLLLPLLIILLSFSAFAGEREQGTLRQLLSLGVNRRDLAFGKSLGIASALALLLIPATAVGVVALALASENGAFQAAMPRMLLMAAGYLLYFSIFVSLSLAVSACARSSRTALVILLGFWIFNSLVAPRAVSDIAKRLHPTPSAFEFAARISNDMKNGLDGHNSADRRTEELKAKVLAQYGVSKVEDLPINFDGIALQEGEEFGNLVFDKHYSELWDSFRRQNRVYQGAAVFAPMLTVQSYSMGMAGTDFEHHVNFQSAAEDYRRMFVKTMNDDMTVNSKTNTWGTYLRGQDLWEQVPDFSYTAPDVGWALSNQVWNIGLLALWSIAAALAALFTTKGMKV
jgi:ABC-2 type transport system permease protein